MVLIVHPRRYPLDPEGRYEESINISSLPSLRAALQPTAIKNYPGEKVIIDGTTALKPTWRSHSNGSTHQRFN